jgi:hypothetical protein
VVATKLRAWEAELYEADFHVWALQQAEKLRAHRLDELDVANLAEEIEGLAIAVRSAVRSRTRTIIEHLLELEHSPAAEPRHGWRRTLRIQRKELADDLSASLRAQLSDDLEQLYADGRENAADDLRARGEHGAAAALPATCPYAFEQILSDWQPQEPQAPASA